MRKARPAPKVRLVRPDHKARQGLKVRKDSPVQLAPRAPKDLKVPPARKVRPAQLGLRVRKDCKARPVRKARKATRAQRVQLAPPGRKDQQGYCLAMDRL